MAGGRLDVSVGAVASLMSSIASGTATPIAIAGRTADPALPGIPTVADLGFAGVEADVWWGVFAPAATPRAVVARINDGINTVMETEESKRLLARNGAAPGRMSIEAFEQFVTSEFRKWSNLARTRGIGMP